MPSNTEEWEALYNMAKKKNAVRADGRIAVQVYLGRDGNGKRKYKTAYGYTQKEADANAEKIKLAMRRGIDVTAERDTFGEWAERWIKVKAMEVSNGQTVAYKSAIKHFNRYIKDAPISKIKTADIQDVIIDLTEENPNTGKPTAKQTLKVIKLTAVQIFQIAIENRVLDYNPAKAVKLPGDAPKDKRRALTEEEQTWILNTEHRAKRAAMIMMYAGLRRGELIPLLWSDIDLDNRTIAVNKSVEKKNGKFKIKFFTKTDAGMRVVDIPQRLVDFLKSEKHESIYVCLSAKKRMHTESSWNRMWESYLTELNMKYGDFGPFQKQPKSKFDPKGIPFVIPNITPHWLRHTFATMLYFAGVDILTAKEQLGHSDIKTTLEIYTHLDKKYKRKSMKKLNEYLDDASQMQVKES